LRVGQWGLVRQGYHIVPARRSVGDEKGIHGLAGCNGDDIRGEGVDIVGVCGDNRELVAGDLYVVLGKERSVDNS
jgi:hypothetical protein